MPDIAMCRNIHCSMRGSCYRYLVIPSERQSYSMFYCEGTDTFSFLNRYWSKSLAPTAIRSVEEADKENEK